jgi:glycyl-tRNA synthetase beta chain
VARDLLLEIGAEEIPASFVEPAVEELKQLIEDRMTGSRLDHGRTRVFATPRRLALWIEDILEASADVSKEVLGPPAKVGFDASGKPTKAAEKFAQGLGLSVGQLARVQTPKGEYLAARVEEKGRPAHAILTEAVHAAVHGLKFQKSMRWGDVEQTFARPVHWIVALFGEEVLPVTFADVRAGRVTYGHRFLSPAGIALRLPAEYEAALERAGVIPDVLKRRALLQERLLAAASRAGGQLLDDPSLTDQVNELIEAPNPVVGSFDLLHLELPREVLIQEMKSHQRYFALVDAQDRLLPKFIAVSNTAVSDPEVSRRGYERVLSARLADGRFFFDEDRKTPLGARVEKLRQVVWQEKLGSYADKVERMSALAKHLAERAAPQLDRAILDRAAQLSKADLVTGMVGEFPELQGVMGREYAKASGEREEVALAIFEHYLPRGASDRLPSRDEGAILGIADRLDTIAAIFALGKPPTGAADPFGLRRACLAVIHVTLDRGFRFSLSDALEKAFLAIDARLSGSKPPPTHTDARKQVLEFFRGRLKALWADKHRPDLVEAVLAAGFDDIFAAGRRLEALSATARLADFVPLTVAFKRVVNIVEKQGKDVRAGQVNSDRLVDPAEVALYAANVAAKKKVADLAGHDDFRGVLREITGLKPEVDHFFDKVMVMTEERELRENRIHLLQEVRDLFNRVADFSKVQAEA